MTERERLIELIGKVEINEKMLTSDGEFITSIHRRIVDRSEVKLLADHLLANGVIVPPCKVGDLPDRIFSHNAIISIWVDVPEEHYAQRLWRGMAWDIPEEYKEMPFKEIFGSIPESLCEADTINVLVELTKEEAEKALKERSEGE